MSHTRNNTTTALRWRARMTKEAIDSALLDEEFVAVGGVDDKKTTHTTTRVPPFCTVTRVVDAVVAVAVLSTLWSLTVTHTWYMALTSTVQVIICVAVWWQQQHTQQQQHTNTNKTTYTPHKQHSTNQLLRTRTLQLWQHNERLYHTLQHHDADVDRVHELQMALQQLLLKDKRCKSPTIDALVTLTHDCAVTNEQLKVGLQRQVCQLVIEAVLEDTTTVVTTNTADFSSWQLSGAALERLILRLRHLSPAVEFDEGALRDLLVNHPNATSNSSDNDRHDESSWSAVWKLLRQVVVVQPPPDALSSLTRNTAANSMPNNNNTQRSAIIVRLDPHQLLVSAAAAATSVSNTTTNDSSDNNNTDLLRLYDC